MFTYVLLRNTIFRTQIKRSTFDGFILTSEAKETLFCIQGILLTVDINIQFELCIEYVF